MILFLAVIFPVLSIILFKLFGKFKVDTTIAIVLNYILAAGICFYLFDKPIDIKKITHQPWFLYAVGLGGAFLFNFYLIGKSTQSNGVGITTFSNKMSLVIPIILGFFVLAESLKGIKIGAVALAGLGIFLVTFNTGGKYKKWYLLFFVFLITGFMEFLLGYIQKEFFTQNSGFEIFIALTFCSGFLFGVIPLLWRITKINIQSVLGGVLLGCMNGLGVYYLFSALQNSADNGVALSIVNVGGLLLATLAGYLFFKEKMSTVNWVGILICAISIYLFQEI